MVMLDIKFFINIYYIKVKLKYLIINYVIFITNVNYIIIIIKIYFEKIIMIMLNLNIHYIINIIFNKLLLNY